ncbi:MAG: DEAD/DEAH box helicase [Caedimonas sp.]|nr:DEAD/DEAH box helicase [Caedimonas sp.]
MFFNELGLGEKTLKGVCEAGYETPTPVQEQVIPYVLNRCDVFGCAQTGTGKTASFTLPLLDILESGRARARMPRILILAPTRELAHQVAVNFSTYGKYHKFKLVLIIGGESIYEQERKLTQGADILIATPGRFLDLFDRGKIMLHALEVIVIDEADRMLDMGFIPEIEKIFSLIPAKRQTLMFSATVSPEVRKLSQTFLKDFVEVSVSPSSKAAETVQHYLVRVGSRDKRKALRHIIQAESVKSAIIFCNRKRDISTLCASLTRHGYNAAPLHGDLHQTRRTETLNIFKQGQIDFLVASDVAARGIDVAELDFVFNFDVPVNAEEYVHRIGRTGRAGRSGRAFMFVTKEDSIFLKSIQKLLKLDIPEYPLSIKDKRAVMEDKQEQDQGQGQETVFKKSKAKKSAAEPQKKQKMRSEKPFSNDPVIGFGDVTPAFMKNYFPHLGPMS